MSRDVSDEENTMNAEREREIRDNQTYVVMRALERVLSRKTDPPLAMAILEDLVDEVRRASR